MVMPEPEMVQKRQSIPTCHAWWLRNITFESIDEADGAWCVRTAGLVCEAEVS